MSLPSSLCRCLMEDLSEKVHKETLKQKLNLETRRSHTSIEGMSYYWVLLSVCGVMHSPPVGGPLPGIPHHVIQTKSICRIGHHLQGRENKAGPN